MLKILKSFGLLSAFINVTFACTSILVSKGASADGSVMITYACDGEFHPQLSREAAADWGPTDSLELRAWGGKVRGKIPRVPHTYAKVGLINEHQLAIGETTFSGREELENPDGLLHYWELMNIALRRAKTAREAIKVITDLVEEYGYRSTGESFSIADKNEVWILEMIGPGQGGIGALWVAMKVPEGTICAHANKAVIGEFPLKDPKNCLYSKNVIEFAIKKGYYDPKTDGPFRFNDVYCPPTPSNRRYASARVWSIFRRAAPSLDLSSDYHRSVEGAKDYPLFVRPDKKLTLQDVIALMRDHYEETEFDMRQGIDAGPYGNPNRWRPIEWEVDGEKYAWERPVSTQQTGFSMVTQSRSWLPDPIGGVLWYGLDETYTSCYAPFYCCINELPESYTTGNIHEFSWESAWWAFNFVSNFATIKYNYMVEDIKAVQQKLESDFMALQPVVDHTAEALYKSEPQLMVQYLTDYSVMHAENVVKKWGDLGRYLIVKYNDGYVKDESGHIHEQGYSRDWLHKVLQSCPRQYKLLKGNENPESKLID
ncbi:MAG: C69 family dipeptidase [Candidatus Marinimicrobia bacterium]|nr:C69 family dipeptidase [Candidatus Neomarinimicrobiota bacterium]